MQKVLHLRRAFNGPCFLWFKTFALIITLQEYGKLKKKKAFLQKCISQILFINTEQRSKIQISLQVFFKDSVDRFRTTYDINGFLWSCFSKILLIDFRTATNIKSGSSKMYSWKILFIDFKISTIKIIYLKVQKGKGNKKYWIASALIFLVYYHLKIHA